MSRRHLPSVSCIVAVYNGEAYLHEAIDSLMAQEYPRLEIIVVDDGSTDRTAEVIAGYGDRVRALRQENRGVSVARNRGVASSTGELLCFLDADDRLEPRKIAVQVDAFEADERLDLCDCHTSYFWSPELPAEVLTADHRYAEPFWRQVLPHHISTWLFRRTLWERIGEFSAGMRYSEDSDWLSRGLDLSMQRLTLPDVLTHRRLHPGNVTARHRDEQLAKLADMFLAHVHRKRTNGRLDLQQG
jgi:glycosyltransferase involved in cell wall biosynthesis